MQEPGVISVEADMVRGSVCTRREHRSVLYRIADERVSAIVVLTRQLLRENAEHVAACCTIDAGAR